MLLVQDFTPRIHLSEEDFAVMTRNGTLLDSEGQLQLETFDEIMRDQIKQYVRRQITNTLTVGPQCVATETVQLSTMKAILHEQVQPTRYIAESPVLNSVSTIDCINLSRQQSSNLSRQEHSLASLLWSSS